MAAQENDRRAEITQVLQETPGLLKANFTYSLSKLFENVHLEHATPEQCAQCIINFLLLLHEYTIEQYSRADKPTIATIAQRNQKLLDDIVDKLVTLSENEDGQFYSSDDPVKYLASNLRSSWTNIHAGIRYSTCSLPEIKDLYDGSESDSKKVDQLLQPLSTNGRRAKIIPLTTTPHGELYAMAHRALLWKHGTLVGDDIVLKDREAKILKAIHDSGISIANGFFVPPLKTIKLPDAAVTLLNKLKDGTLRPPDDINVIKKDLGEDVRCIGSASFRWNRKRSGGRDDSGGGYGSNAIRAMEG